MPHPKYHINHVNTTRPEGDEVSYFQILSPAGKVVYDHLQGIDGAQQFCSFLNRGLQEITDKYQPLLEAVDLFLYGYEVNQLRLAVEARQNMAELMESFQ